MPYWDYAQEVALEGEAEALAEYERALDQGVSLTMDVLTSIAMSVMIIAFLFVITIIQEFLKDIFGEYGDSSMSLPDVIIT
jgi:hypothetical protein